MTLEEAIIFHVEMAEDFREEAEHVREICEYTSNHKRCYNEPVKAYRDCAKEHEQLAEWLSSLKELKDAYESNYQVQDVIEVCVRLWG